MNNFTITRKSIDLLGFFPCSILQKVNTVEDVFNKAKFNSRELNVISFANTVIKNASKAFSNGEQKENFFCVKAGFNGIYDSFFGEIYVGNGFFASCERDCRFLGKDFIKKLSFYCLCKVYENTIGNFDWTDEEGTKLLNDLTILKKEIFG